MKRAVWDGRHGKNDLRGCVMNSCIKISTIKQSGGL